METNEFELQIRRLNLKINLNYISVFLVAIITAGIIVSIFAGTIEFVVPIIVLTVTCIWIVFGSKNGRALDFILKFVNSTKSSKSKESKITLPHRYKSLKFTSIFFSTKTQKEVFLTAMSDWDEEVFEALRKDKDANLFMINVRNTYGFIITMWQKSPLGDLLEYVRKFAS